MNTATTTVDLGQGVFARRSVLDWVFALLAGAGAAFAFTRYGQYMDVYEKGILLASAPAAVWLAWFWRPARNLMLGVAAIALLAVWSYQGSLARA